MNKIRSKLLKRLELRFISAKKYIKLYNKSRWLTLSNHLSYVFDKNLCIKFGAGMRLIATIMSRPRLRKRLTRSIYG